MEKKDKKQKNKNKKKNRLLSLGHQLSRSSLLTRLCGKHNDTEEIKDNFFFRKKKKKNTLQAHAQKRTDIKNLSTASFSSKH